MQIHVQKFTKICKYFTGNIGCPFEELGCKFRHEEHRKDISEEKDDMNIDRNSVTEEIQSLDDFSSCEKESSFHTSTPKSWKCEECMDRSECADCIIRQVLGKYGGIKLNF